MVVDNVMRLIDRFAEASTDLQWIEKQKFFMEDPETEMILLRGEIKQINEMLTEIGNED